MRPAIDSGIVTGDAPVSYWPIFSQFQKSLRKLTRPISLLVSKVANQYYINGNSSLQHQAVSFISTDMDKGRVEVPWFLERGVSSIRLYNLLVYTHSVILVI